MDSSAPLEKNNSPRQIAKLAFERYFYYSRTAHLPAAHRLVCAFQVMECAQIFAIIVRRGEGQGMTWNYGGVGWLWSALELTVLPPALLSWLSLSATTITSLLAILITSKLLTLFSLSLLFAFSRSESFEYIASGGDKHYFLKLTLVIDQFLSVFLLRVSAIPSISFFSSEIHSGNVLFGNFACLCLLLSLKLIDVTYMCSTNWFSNDLEAVSTPLSHVHMWATTLLFTLFVSFFDYSAQEVRFCAILISIGAYKAVILLRTAPYHHQTRNLFELTKAVTIFWSGISLLLGLYTGSPPDSMLSTILFTLLSPQLVLILSVVLRREQTRVSKVQYPHKLFEVEHILRRQVAKGRSSSRSVDVAFTRACELFPKSEQMVVWALYYYKYLKDVTFVQVNVSKLMKTPWSVLNYVECYHCYRIVLAYIRSLPDQAEPLSFWKYQQSLKEVMAKDYEITKIHCELFSELAGEGPKVEKVARLARNVSIAIGEYNKFVQRVMKQHPICPELLSLYSDFLYVLTNSKHAGKYQHLAVKVSDMLKANRTDNSVDLYDSRCLIVVMSLEKSTLGTIIWAKNTELLGYSPGDIVGTDHNIVIPVPLKDKHTNMLKRITMFRHHHPVYESRHHLYFAHRSGSIVGAHWKVRLVNLPVTGDMCIVAALKPRHDANTIALLDDGGVTVTAMVLRYTDQKLPSASNGDCWLRQSTVVCAGDCVWGGERNVGRREGVPPQGYDGGRGDGRVGGPGRSIQHLRSLSPKDPTTIPGTPLLRRRCSPAQPQTSARRRRRRLFPQH